VNPKSWNYSLSVQIDHFGSGLSATQYFLIGPHRFNARSRDGERLHPRRFCVSGVDVAVNQERVGGKKHRRYEQRRNRGTPAHNLSADSHTIYLEER